MKENAPTFQLRPLTLADAADLQRVYDLAPATFVSLKGQPALAGQAEEELRRLEGTSGRFQFGMVLDGQLIGVIDCKLADDEEGLAFIGFLLMAEPFADDRVAALALRMLERWLALSYRVRRLETAVPAHSRTAIRFWSEQGFRFTGEQHRREMGNRAPRFLQMAREVAKFTN